MTLKEILQNIGNRHGVNQLNSMQKATTAAKADRIILLAPTGSGKTIAFAVPLASRLKEPCGKVQAVVIAPSRELVLQIADVLRPIVASSHPEDTGAQGYKTAVLYGGHNMKEETNTLSAQPDIVVATPGRLLDHLLRGTIDLSSASQLVLDEYDKALELGFLPQMKRIVGRMPAVKYVTLSSATPLDELPDFIDLSQAKILDYTSKEPAPRNRTSIQLVRADNADKLQSLQKLLESLPNGKTLVFANHRQSAERIYNFLAKAGFPVGLYHGGLEQNEREAAVLMFSNGTTPILVCTDLASRGLDVEAVRSVVHYHLPPTAENWTHRNGRTARAGAEGEVYVLVAPDENVPSYIDFDGEYVPSPDNPDPIHSEVATIYFNAGKKEKLSKADILGFLTKQCGLAGSEVGKIDVKDHAAFAAVPRAKAQEVLKAAALAKVKGQRLRISLYE